LRVLRRHSYTFFTHSSFWTHAICLAS
jgi:hypothetical protein